MYRPSTNIISYKNREITTYYPALDEEQSITNAFKNYSGRTSFNYSVTEFGDFFNWSRGNNIVNKDRIRENSDNLFISSQTNRSEKAFDNIRKISNLENSLSFEQSQTFLESFKDIFFHISEEYNWKNSDYFLVPLKGGGVITELFNELNPSKILKVDSKRVPIDEPKYGRYSFGMHIPRQLSAKNSDEADQFVDNFSGKKITILELCVASGITTIGFLLDLYHRKIFPGEIVVLSTAMAQQGYEESIKFAKYLGFDLKFVSAKLVYMLKDHYLYNFDPLTYDNDELVLKSPYDALQLIYNTQKKVR